MYRSLNIETLGITGRQSELIELALTYRFKGLDLDIEAYFRQVEKRGQEAAARFIDSAARRNLLEPGSWILPVKLDGDDEAFKAKIQKLPAIANAAAVIGATRCVTTLMGGSDSRPLQENFEFHSQRLHQIAELLAPHNIRLGVGFQAAAGARVGLEHQFIDTAEGLLTLVKSINSPQVGLLIDTWNWHLGGGTIEQVAALPIDQIVAVRVADVPVGATAAAVNPKDRLLPSLTGTVPVAGLLTKLSEMNYDGPVSSYPHVSQLKGIVRDKVVQMSAEALRAVWPGAEIKEEEAAEAEAAASGSESNGAAPARSYA